MELVLDPYGLDESLQPFLEELQEALANKYVYSQYTLEKRYEIEAFITAFLLNKCHRHNLDFQSDRPKSDEQPNLLSPIPLRSLLRRCR